MTTAAAATAREAMLLLGRPQDPSCRSPSSTPLVEAGDARITSVMGSPRSHTVTAPLEMSEGHEGGSTPVASFGLLEGQGAQQASLTREVLGGPLASPPSPSSTSRAVAAAVAAVAAAVAALSPLAHLVGDSPLTSPSSDINGHLRASRLAESPPEGSVTERPFRTAVSSLSMAGGGGTSVPEATPYTHTVAVDDVSLRSEAHLKAATIGGGGNSSSERAAGLLPKFMSAGGNPSTTDTAAALPSQLSSIVATGLSSETSLKAATIGGGSNGSERAAGLLPKFMSAGGVPSTAAGPDQFVGFSIPSMRTASSAPYSEHLAQVSPGSLGPIHIIGMQVQN